MGWDVRVGRDFGWQAADVEKLIWQRNTRGDRQGRVAFARTLMIEKISNAQETLKGRIPEELSERSFAILENLKSRLAEESQKSVGEMCLDGGGKRRSLFQRMAVLGKQLVRNAAPSGP